MGTPKISRFGSVDGCMSAVKCMDGVCVVRTDHCVCVCVCVCACMCVVYHVWTKQCLW